MKREARKLFRFLRTKPLPANTNEILALERTKLANERTLLAYIGASLYLLLGGIALLQLKDFSHIHWLGHLALIVCVLFLAIGIVRYILLHRRLSKWNRILYVDTKSKKDEEQNDIKQKSEKDTIQKK